ncbi:MAG: hypothetical protein WBC44_07190, partial [Planctomycetaceae bacterium]
MPTPPAKACHPAATRGRALLVDCYMTAFYVLGDDREQVGLHRRDARTAGGRTEGDGRPFVGPTFIRSVEPPCGGYGGRWDK